MPKPMVAPNTAPETIGLPAPLLAVSLAATSSQEVAALFAGRYLGRAGSECLAPVRVSSSAQGYDPCNAWQCLVSGFQAAVFGH